MSSIVLPDLIGKKLKHLRRNFIQVFRLDIVGVLALVILKITGAYSAPGIGCPPDKWSSQSPLGLVDLGACNLVDKTLVEFKSFLGVSNTNVGGSAGRDGLMVLGTHDASHTGSASGVFNPGHDIGKAHEVFAGRTDHKAFDLGIA